jgi:co-chaperonin GroES (HSP10)
MQTSSNVIFKPVSDWSVEDAFPTVDCGREPLASTVVVQLRTPKRKTQGGIILTEQDRDTEKHNTQIARVVAIGPTCFKDQKTLEPWPEGPWYSVGDFVSVPLYVGDRWWRQIPTRPRGEYATFALFGHLDIRAKVTGNPLDEIVTV